jgi:alkylation response protein AidB-like acyl-CoA dehydrogenase
VDQGRSPDAALQVRMRGAAVLATEVATDVVTRAFRAAGGGALSLDGVLQRCLRDLHAGAQHFMVSDSAFAVHGRALLGLPGVDPLG